MSYVYDFDYPHGLPLSELRALLGGKAANLVVMANELGLPVPPGFTITTAACNGYLVGGWPDGLDEDLRTHMRRVEELVGRRFGDPADPMVVSVRSGAPVSMPGMMDTILNLGLNDATEAGLAAAAHDPVFAVDCHRRFREMYREIVSAEPVPEDPWQQLRGAIEAVFRSWNSDRAKAYRRHESISDDLGTAVTIQTMVFGNRGADSGTGVLFTRNPATGEPTLYGDFMFNAQGEDVVAGTHETQPLAVLDERLPAVARELRRYADLLEHHYADLCDIEFTVERGKLWLLQVRVGKRSPQAALRVAVDMAEAADFPHSREEAVRRVAHLLAHPPLISSQRCDGPAPLTVGLAASPGVASGEIVTTPEAAEAGADAGRTVILVRSETSPEDVHGMARAAGVLTARGGLASHAAVVARGWGIPAVVGASAVEVGQDGVVIASRTFAVGEVITIDGSTGEVFPGEVAGSRTMAPEAATLLSWARELGIEVDQGEEELQAESFAPNGEPTADDVLRALLLKGLVTPDPLAVAVSSTPEHIRPVVDRLVAEGLAEVAAGAFRLTATGKLRALDVFAADRGRLGVERAASALDGFLPLDHGIKDTVTAWQMRDVAGGQTINDHSDPDYDAAVLDRLAALDEEVLDWLAPLAAALPRLGNYRRRLQRALALACEGDQRFVASPRVDSYHSVWFELHEDLIRLAGRRRSDEAAAGRA